MAVAAAAVDAVLRAAAATTVGSEQLSMQGDRLVITFDAFVGDEQPQPDYIVKKLAISNVNTGATQMWFFGPPFPWYRLSERARNRNCFVSNYITGTSWFDGYLPYEQLQMVLLKYTERASEIYVKGQTCVKYLTNMLGRPVINMDPLISEMPPEVIRFLKLTVKPLRCMMDHRRVHSRPGFDGAEYTCCQDRAHLFGHVMRRYLEMPDVGRLQRGGSKDINRHELAYNI